MSTRLVAFTVMFIACAFESQASPKPVVKPVIQSASPNPAFRSAFDKTPEGLRYKSANSEAYIAPFGDGRGGRVSAMENSAAGEVKMTTFSIPESDLTPSSARIMSASDGRFAVHRHYDLLSGSVTVRSGFRVETIGDRFVRTQANERKSTKEFESSVRATSEGDLHYSLILRSPGPGGQKDFLGRITLPPEAYGRIVGYTMSGNGQSIKVHLLKDDAVVERVLVLKPEPKASPADPSNFHVDTIGNARPLAASEIEKLGFFKAKVQTFAGRTETPGKAPRNLQVGGQQ